MYLQIQKLRRVSQGARRREAGPRELHLVPQVEGPLRNPRTHPTRHQVSFGNPPSPHNKDAVLGQGREGRPLPTKTRSPESTSPKWLVGWRWRWRPKYKVEDKQKVWLHPASPTTRAILNKVQSFDDHTRVRTL